MNETIYELNKTNSIFESDPLESELRILDWIFNQVDSNKLRQCNVISRCQSDIVIA